MWLPPIHVCVIHYLSISLSQLLHNFQSNLFVLVVLWIGFNSVKQLVNNTKCSDTNKRTQWPQPKRIALLSSFESIIKSSFWYKITHVIVAAETSRKKTIHVWTQMKGNTRNSMPTCFNQKHLLCSNSDTRRVVICCQIYYCFPAITLTIMTIYLNINSWIFYSNMLILLIKLRRASSEIFRLFRWISGNC